MTLLTKGRLSRASEDGIPALNTLFYLYPRGPRALAVDTQFFYGVALLVSSIIEENATAVAVSLPDDFFYDWRTHRKVVIRAARLNIAGQGFANILVFLHDGSGATRPVLAS